MMITSLLRAGWRVADRESTPQTIGAAGTCRTWSRRAHGVVAGLVAALLWLLAAVVPAASAATTLSPACTSINNGEAIGATSALPSGLSGSYAIGAPTSPGEKLARANNNNYHLRFNPGEIISYSFDLGTGSSYRMAILQSRSTTLTRPGSLENGTGSLNGTITVVAPDDVLTVGISNYTTNTNARTTGAAQPGRASSSTTLRISCAERSSSSGITMTHSGTAMQGGTLSYTISVSGAVINNPPLTATFYLPEGMTFVAASGTNWTCSGASNSGSCTTTAPFAEGNCPPITLVVSIGNNADSPLLPVVQLTDPHSPNGLQATDPTLLAAPTVSEIHPSWGPGTGGASVWIIGTNLGHPTAVMFGAVPSSGWQITSPTEIIARAPAGVGTVDVQVVTGAGTSATSAAHRYTYIAPPVVTSINPASGPGAGGTSVTINGTGFAGVTAVYFGAGLFGADLARSFTVNSATSITATTRGGVGTVDVRVTAAGGTSAISTNDQYRYIAVPTVTSISPATGPVAGGTSVTITGTGFTGATAVTFGATPATGFTVNSATQITATAPAGTGTGTVDARVTTADGTSATSAADRFSYVSTPIVTSLSPASGPVTGGNSVTITGTGFTGATAVKFGATAATGFTVVSATQITVTAPAGRVGTVDVTVTTPGGTSTSSAGDRFSYVAVPVLRTWVSGTGNDANACSRSAPCLTFAGAFANTLAGGEINCVDGADYGAVTITRAVAIVCDAAGAQVLVSNGDGIVVNAGASDAVTLSGLDIYTNPENPFDAPLSGIKLLSAGSLTIANTQLRGFTGSYAVEIVPTAPLVSVLLDRVSVARGPGSIGGSMLVSPASGGTARVSILHSRFDASRAQGVHFDSVGKTGVTISALIQDSLFVSNYAGLVATARAGAGTISLTVLGTSFSRNTNAAIIIGAVTALFGNSTISTNGTGLLVQDGAVVRSAGDNRLGGNTVDGAFTAQAARR